jgi:hypothetical protein
MRIAPNNALSKRTAGILLLLFALACSPAWGNDVNLNIVYTQYAFNGFGPSVGTINVQYVFATNTLTLSGQTSLNTSIGGADGIVFDPNNGNILVASGGQAPSGGNAGAPGIVYQLTQSGAAGSPATLTFGPAPNDCSNCLPNYSTYDLVVVPANGSASGFTPGTLVATEKELGYQSITVYPLSPTPGNGLAYPVTGDDLDVNSIAFDSNGVGYYAFGTATSNACDFGTIVFDTVHSQFVTHRLFSNVPSHRLSFDPLTGDIFTASGNSVGQYDPPTGIFHTLQLGSVGAELTTPVNDGQGHVLISDNANGGEGDLVLVDYSAAAGHFIDQPGVQYAEKLLVINFVSAAINFPVAVSPSVVTVQPGQSQQFAALVNELSNQPVSWGINPVVGSITAGGNYSAPAVITSGQTVTVTATSTNTPSESGTATITLAPYTIWNSSTRPTRVDNGADNPVELGVLFRPDTNGTITGIRFYKSSANTGVHTGELWSSTGTLLATATFSNETTSGWQQVNFNSPVTVGANTLYVASYHTSIGHYSADISFFANNGVDNSPLHALQNGVSGANGIYSYGASGTFPSNTYQATNYWVDLVFVPDTSPLTSIQVTPASSTLFPSATQQLAATGTYSDSTQQNLTAQAAWSSSNTAVATVSSGGLVTAVSGGSATIYAKSAGITGMATVNVRTLVSIAVTPASPTVNVGSTQQFTATGTYQDNSTQNITTQVTWNSSNTTAATISSGGLATGQAAGGSTISAVLGSINSSSSNGSASLTVMTPPPPTCPCTIWSSSTTPTVVDSGAGPGVEVGVKFTSSSSGTITGVRFYKSSANTGTHIGNLWTSGGTLLATATFSGETLSGWQQVSFSPAVTIAANTEYVASYYTSVGHFSADQGYFATGVSNPPLQALSSGVAGGNGVYAYSGSSTFPSGSYNSTNYWVDVVFSQTTQAPLVSIAVTPTNDPTVNVGGTQQFTATGTYQDNSTQNITTQVTWSSSNTTAVAINSGGLATGEATGSSMISASLSGINSPSESLTVAASSGCPCTIWSSSTTPTVADSGAGPGVEVGVKFSSSSNGTITGIRFYKSSANTGTHVGNLWTSTGTLLATATFSGETTSGWQQVNFSAPVSIAANTVYVASYHTNVSHFAADQGFFAAGVSNAPLQALSNAAGGGNGVYVYGSGGVFPSSSYNSTNYWVDVAFTPTVCPCSVWNGSAVPTVVDAGGGSGVEVGMKFTSNSSGMVTGMSFYKSSANTGTHVGNLWTSGGTLLATATFSGETASGWQTVSFSPAVAITANTEYVVSYHTTVGHFSADQGFFATGVNNFPLQALSSGVAGGNGVYVYGAGGIFPNNSYNSTNYWVDVIVQ